MISKRFSCLIFKFILFLQWTRKIGIDTDAKYLLIVYFDFLLIQINTSSRYLKSLGYFYSMNSYSCPKTENCLPLETIIEHCLQMMMPTTVEAIRLHWKGFLIRRIMGVSVENTNSTGQYL